MKCTDILMEEHQVILKNLNELEDILNLEHLDTDSIISSIEFIREYADKYHHAKEEDIYFKWMIDKQPGFENGPIHCMLKEHEQGRMFITNAEEALKSKDQVKVKENMFNFIHLLREHINKEDTILYQMANNVDKSFNDGDKLMLPEFMKVQESLIRIHNKYK